MRPSFGSAGREGRPSVGASLARLRRATCAVLLAWGLSDAASAQRYLVRTYDELDTISSSFIADIAQAPDGRMWMLTRSELFIYDGTLWERAQVPMENLSQARLQFDARGNPWIVSRDGVLATTTEGAWITWPGFRSFSMEPTFTTTIVETESGPRILIGSHGGGLHAWQAGVWNSVTGFENIAVHGLLTYGDRVLAATDEGLLAVEGERIDRELAAHLDLPAGPVLGVALEPGADTRREDFAGLWVLGSSWIGKVRAGRCESLVDRWNSEIFHADRPPRLQADGQGGLYFGDPDVLVFAGEDGAPPHCFGVQQGLLCEGATALFLDRESTLWIGGRKGLSRLTSRRFASYDSHHGLYEDEVSAILELESGELVLGHNGGLTFLDGSSTRKHVLPSAPRNPIAHGRVIDLCDDGNGGFYICSWAMGLGHWRPDGSVTWTSPALRRITKISSMVRDSQGRLWVCGEGGVVELDETLREMPGASGVLLPLVRTLAVGPDDTLYAAAARNGLYVHREGTWSRVENPDGGRWNDLATVYVARDGQVWVGSKCGVQVLRGDHLEPAAPPALRFDLPVFSFLEDRHSRLWIGTLDGVFVWNGVELEHFCIEHGLAGHEVNRAACMTDRQGRVWIGTDRGVSRFDERYDRRDRTGPSVEFLSLESAGERSSSRGEVELEPRPDSVTIRARAVSFLDERNMRFRFRMEGFDSDWLETTGSTFFETRYTSLPPGSYRFQIQARAIEGPWGALASSGPIAIARPLWQRPWFVALAVCALAALGWLALAELSHRRYASRLEREVQLRTRELSDSRAEIAREKERVSATLASIAEGVVAVDGEGRILLLNRSAENLLGWREEDARGRALDGVLSLVRTDGTLVDTRELCGALAPELGLRRRNLSIECRRGGWRSVELSIAPVVARDGASAGAVIVLQDVTERRRMESELARAQRLDSLGALAGGIAHDFNNVLTAAGGYVGLLELELPGPRSAIALLGAASRAIERAGELAHQLLTFARGGEPVRAPTHLSVLVRNAAGLAFSGSAVRWSPELPDDLWPIDVDSSQVQQVFENLLINARQAMLSRGRVSVRAQNVEIASGDHVALESGRYVRVDVEDEGPGIAAEHLEHVFDPFFTTKPDGTGLGLATAYSIVRRHGGAIAVRSTPGLGTTFSVFLPFSSRAPDVPEADAHPRPRWIGRALVLDDQAAVRAVLRGYLERMGWKVVAVESAEQAVWTCREARVAERRFDVAFLDLTLPGGLGGSEAAQILAREAPEVALVAMSGYSDDAAIATPGRYGFRATLPKPFRVQDVARVLAELAPSQRSPA